MTITITLLMLHFVIIGIALYLLVLFVFWRSSKWYFQKAYDYMVYPLILIVSPFIAIFTVFVLAVCGVPSERIKQHEETYQKKLSKQIHLFSNIYLWIDPQPYRWCYKIFLIRKKNTAA